MVRKKHNLILVVILAVVCAVLFFIILKGNVLITDIFGPSIPSAMPYNPTPSSTVAPAHTTPKPTSGLSQEINLDVPFTSQAPFGNWGEPYQDFCEEASALMTFSYVTGQSIPNPDFANAKMFEIKAFEEKRFGYSQDTTAEETATIIREFYKYPKVKVVYNPSIADIKLALSQGKAIIIPAAGQQLGNPYYTQPGPLYHMLVIKGYTKDGRFITNDPGTRHGANFIYNLTTLFNAIHDWNGGNVTEGKKVMITVG